ncbi:MAG: hypothetical protein IJ443_01415 [Firmicutes bacterium]|nr:hypothetical protein [Bacillota bacterium]
MTEIRGSNVRPLHRQEYENLAEALGKIVWAYVLIHLAFNLGNLDVLPDWLGYVLIVRTLPVLNHCIPSALLLQPFGFFLIGWNGFLWIIKLFGTLEIPMLVTVLAGIINIYFMFQLLTNIAEIAEMTGCGIPDSIRMLRNADAVLTTLLCLPLLWEKISEMPLFALGFLLAGVAVVLAIGILLNQMKKDLREASERI